MGRPAHPLGAQFEAVLLAYIEAHGDNFDRSCLVQEYLDRGVSRATIYRWIDSVLSRRRPFLPRTVQVAGAEPLPDPPVIIPAMPRVPTFDDVATMGPVAVLELLSACIMTAQELISHARGPGGVVRNARAMLVGSDHLRRAVETAAKLNESIAVQQEIQQFHCIVLEEIAAEPPAVQQRILTRIQGVCNRALAA